MSAQERLRRLEELLLEQKEAGSLSVEALLDLLLCFYTECSNSPLKREKHVTDFLDWGKNRSRTLQKLPRDLLKETPGSSPRSSFRPIWFQRVWLQSPDASLKGSEVLTDLGRVQRNSSRIIKTGSTHCGCDPGSWVLQRNRRSS